MFTVRHGIGLSSSHVQQYPFRIVLPSRYMIDSMHVYINTSPVFLLFYMCREPMTERAALATFTATRGDVMFL